MSEHGVDLDKKGMRVRLPCGCKIITRAEDDADMLAVIPNGSKFMCKHGYALTFTGTNQWTFTAPFGTIYSVN